MPILDETGRILKTGRYVAQGAAIATGTAAVVAAGGVALAGYGIYAWLMEDGIFDKIGTATGNFFTWVGTGFGLGGPQTWGGPEPTKENQTPTQYQPTTTPPGQPTYEEQIRAAYGDEWWESTYG